VPERWRAGTGRSERAAEPAREAKPKAKPPKPKKKRRW
jgi:hypothetical protein